MSSINKIHISTTDTSYDISPSPNGTLDSTSYTSNDVDTVNATSYSDVNKVNNTDTNATIFSKITGMLRNVRYLFNRIGNVDISTIGNSVSDAIVNLNTMIGNRASANHRHTASDLPVSNVQIDSSDYIPTSSLIYNMNQELSSRIEEMNSHTLMPIFTTNITCGAVPSGTYIEANTPAGEMLKRVLRKRAPEDSSDPDYQYYTFTHIDTWNSLTDVDNFFTAHNQANNWDGLKLGNYITINDGVYNSDWIIAGFDCESNQTAADGTTYDNGYGICLIPKELLGVGPDTVQCAWHNTSDLTNLNGYINSSVHLYLNSTVYTALSSVLGSHIVNRNVLLSSELNGTGILDEENLSSNYTWTTAYLTLPSIGQLTNQFRTNQNQYDDGEATYYLPLFRYQEYQAYTQGRQWWTRNICGNPPNDDLRIYFINGNDARIWEDYATTANKIGIRPLMYLR